MGTVAGTVAPPDLVEISGIAASRLEDRLFWAHNDSGDVARVFAITMSGEHRATVVLPGAEAVDWEDMAADFGPTDEPRLYLGDIGDNAAARSEIVIYRISEPDLSDVAPGTVIQQPEFDRITLRYPDRPHDAEAFAIDPVTGDMLVITKDLASDRAFVFRAAAVPPGDASVMLEPAGEILYDSLTTDVAAPAGAPPLVAGAGHLPTGADISQDGQLIAVRTYRSVWIFERPDGGSIADALAGIPCEAPAAIETQGEAVTFVADGYITIGEGANAPIHVFKR